MIHTLLFFLLTLLVLVTVHEFGHFVVARLFGVRVLTFSVGFGKPIFQWSDKTGTRFMLAAIPLGGYVKMLDEREGNVPEAMLEETFNRQSPLARLAIIGAGPIINLLFAFVLYWVVFVIGVTGVKPLIGEIDANSIAQRYGFASGDLITVVDDRSVSSRADVRAAFAKRIGESGVMQFVLVGAGSTTDKTIAVKLSEVGGVDGVDGEMSFLTKMGVEFWYPELPATLDQIFEDGAAFKAGLLSGDKVISIDGQFIQDWRALVDYVRDAPNTTQKFAITRNEQLLHFDVDVGVHITSSGDQVGRIGVTPERVEFPDELLLKQRWSPFQATEQAFVKTLDITLFTVQSIGKMLSGLISTDNLSGPLTIAKYASASAETGIVGYLQFLALLSISLGVLNLLPIPILDGGQIVMIVVESVAGRSLPEKFVMGAQQLGVLLLLALMSLAIYNDFSRM